MKPRGTRPIPMLSLLGEQGADVSRELVCNFGVFLVLNFAEFRFEFRFSRLGGKTSVDEFWLI